MRIGIIGAGVAGLTTAKVLTQAGHEVEIFDRTPDDVETVTREPGTGWVLETRTGAEQPVRQSFDRVVVANGVFSEPAVPVFPGVEEFAAAGGRVLAGSEVLDVEEARDRHVVVVGYGKSACDITAALSECAASADVVARQMLWKVPRKIGGVLNFKMLLLTRMGEALFRYLHLRGVERFLHGPGNGLRRRMLNSIGSVSVRQFGLSDKGLVPGGAMEDIVRGAIGLASEGFFEGVESGSIRVHRDQVIMRLLADPQGRPCAELADGTVLPADLVVCATGFTQSVPFLGADVQEGLFDERGNFMLYRQIQPLDQAGLYFNGYNSSFFSPLNAEMAALWIAADVAGELALPDLASRRAAVVAQLAFMDEATDKHHCRGTKIIPFSMKNVDEVLSDLDLQIGRLTRASHWLNPVDPAAYKKVTPRLLRRLGAEEPATATVTPLPVAADDDSGPVPEESPSRAAL